MLRQYVWYADLSTSMTGLGHKTPRLPQKVPDRTLHRTLLGPRAQAVVRDPVPVRSSVYCLRFPTPPLLRAFGRLL